MRELPSLPHRQRQASPPVVMILCAVVWIVACSAPPTHPPGPFAGTYPGLLRPPEELGPDVVWRQRVTAIWNDGQGQAGSHGFEAVVQKQGPLLTMVGLSPFGSVGFVILWDGASVEIRNESGDELPFPPRFVLLDFQRVFYPWLSDGSAALPDGEHVATRGAEQVTERWEHGLLVERRFRRLDDQPPGDLVVHFSYDLPSDGTEGERRWFAPTRAVLDNAWFRYQLVVDTLEETLLEPSP